MSIKKVTLASLILLSLTACSSGGGSGSSSNNTEAKAKPSVHQPSTQNNSSDIKKAEADRVAKEKAEAERLKKEEADRLAKEKAEAERLKKEEADRLAKEKAEAERLKKEEADRLAKEKAENEHKLTEIKEHALKAGYSDQEATEFAKNNLTNFESNGSLSYLGYEKSNKARDAALAAGLSSEEAEHIASEFSHVDADIRNLNTRISDIQARKKARQEKFNTLKAIAIKNGLSEEEATNLVDNNFSSSDEQFSELVNQFKTAKKARQEKLEKFKVIALEADLTKEEAEELANINLDSELEEFKVAIESFKKEKILVVADQAKGISRSQYPLDTIQENTSIKTISAFNAYSRGNVLNSNFIYNQPYSAVFGRYNGDISYNNETGQILNDNRSAFIDVKGLKTELSAIPNEGSAVYTGKAFNGTFKSSLDGGSPIEGMLSYNVNFNNRTGSGTIMGLGDLIQLEEGNITDTGISSNVRQSYKSGSYSLDFYGPKAEEIGGKASIDGKEIIGFGGTRGEITK